jgi:hypothetical protein
MASSGMLRRVALVRKYVSEGIRLTLLLVHDSSPPDEGGANFLRNVGSYRNHTA